MHLVTNQTRPICTMRIHRPGDMFFWSPTKNWVEWYSIMRAYTEITREKLKANSLTRSLSVGRYIAKKSKKVSY